MKDPLIVLGIAEALLFLATFGLLAGASEISSKRKKIGVVFLLVWVAVLAACIAWVMVRKSS